MSVRQLKLRVAFSRSTLFVVVYNTNVQILQVLHYRLAQDTQRFRRVTGIPPEKTANSLSLHK